jgi:hypothetical protein
VFWGGGAISRVSLSLTVSECLHPACWWSLKCEVSSFVTLDDCHFVSFCLLYLSHHREFVSRTWEVQNEEGDLRSLSLLRLAICPTRGATEEAPPPPCYPGSRHLGKVVLIPRLNLATPPPPPQPSFFSCSKLWPI